MNIFKAIKNFINKNKKDPKDIIIEELTKKEEKKDKLLLTTMWVFLLVMLVLFIIICLLASTYMPEGPLQLVVILVSVVVLLIGALFCLKLEVEAGYYECSKCHHKHKPEYSKVLWAMHYGTTRYLKCPECSNRTWSKKVLSK
jgi:DNA-directed RNA polymerase subunit RPC12/RpoP